MKPKLFFLFFVLIVVCGVILIPFLKKDNSETASCKCLQKENASQSLPASKENLCQCGLNCQCKQTGDKSQCKCGVNCQCQAMSGMVGMSMDHSHSGSVSPFLKIMDEMMVQMEAVALTGSVERDFLVMMIPHHQAAIEMAKYQITNGKNFEMVQLAKSILTEQQGEIMDMEAMLAAYPEGEGHTDTDYKAAMDKTMEVMMKKTPAEAQLPEDVDCCFALIMLPHHRAAVDMARVMLKFSPKSRLSIYAQRIIGDQQIEIDQMSEYVNKNCKK